MESGRRRILPRIQPLRREEEEEEEEEEKKGKKTATLTLQRHPLLLRDANGTTANGIGARGRDAETPSGGAGAGLGTFAAWKPSMAEEIVQKRKREHVEEEQQQQQLPQLVPRSQSQTLPSLRQLLTSPERQNEPRERSRERPGPARLLWTKEGWTIEQGAFYFVAKRPQDRDFPATILADARELSFARVEPELLDVFRHAWYLRHHTRPKRLQGDSWLDHTFFNDAYAIDHVLHTWTPRHDPGSAQYPVSLLYKHCLWIFFNRSMQASQPSPAYAQVVDDGLHFARTLQSAHNVVDGSLFLLPLFLLGCAAFQPHQRRDIRETFERLDFRNERGSATHAINTLTNLWVMMDEGGVEDTWNWEKYQAYDIPVKVSDRALVDLLWDPLRRNRPTSQVQSPETFEASRWRAGPPPPAPPLPTFPQPNDWRRSQNEEPGFSPRRSNSPPRQVMPRPPSPDRPRLAARVIPTGSPSDQLVVNRNFMPPSLPSGGMTNADANILQNLQRKAAKTKSTVPPCPTCGKELKNPSDAQKHQLQHSKPFRCREPGCTRMQGFATENDLQRHRKSVHGASPRIGNKTGYICTACPEPSDGSSRKWWPRLDNFKAHLRRKHPEQDEEDIIARSASARRPDDTALSLSTPTEPTYLTTPTSASLAYHPHPATPPPLPPPPPTTRQHWGDTRDHPSPPPDSSAPTASSPYRPSSASYANPDEPGRSARPPSTEAAAAAAAAVAPANGFEPEPRSLSRDRERDFDREPRGDGGDQAQQQLLLLRGSAATGQELAGRGVDADLGDAMDVEGEDKDRLMRRERG